MGRPLKEVCWRGHPLVGSNLRYRPNGGRECWACRRITWWQAHELEVADKDRRLLSRVFANTYDLIGHEPEALLVDDASRLMRPTRDWLKNESLLCWMAGRFLHWAGLRAEDREQLGLMLQDLSSREGPTRLVIDMPGLAEDYARQLLPEELDERKVGLDNVDVLFMPLSGDPTDVGVLLLKPREPNVHLDGLTLVEVHPDGRSTWWGPFIPPYGAAGWGSFWAAQPHMYGPFKLPLFVSFRAEADGSDQRPPT